MLKISQCLQLLKTLNLNVVLMYLYIFYDLFGNFMKGYILIAMFPEKYNFLIIKANNFFIEYIFVNKYKKGHKREMCYNIY